MEQAFNELGIDAVVGTELMDWLGLSSIDINDPSRFSRLRDVIDYFKQFPVDTQRFLIKRVTNNKNVDKLQQVWEYSHLLRNKQAIEDEMNKVKAELSVVGSTGDPSIIVNLNQRETMMRTELGNITNEIAIYEK